MTNDNEKEKTKPNYRIAVSAEQEMVSMQAPDLSFPQCPALMYAMAFLVYWRNCGISTSNCPAYLYKAKRNIIFLSFILDGPIP